MSAAVIVGAAAAAAMQPAGPGTAAGGSPAGTPAGAIISPRAAKGASDLWTLFQQSFDLFTVMLVLGSVVALAVIISCLIDVRAGRILPRQSINRIGDLASAGRWEDLRDFVARDESFVGRVIRVAMVARRSRQSVREAAEIAAAEESARWFRRIEMLNVIGNLGPLVGLAGTVWGMIIAFTSLGEAKGDTATDLSLGISKALFHTLLGLCLAIPCLLAFGVYRSLVDRLCNRGLVICGQIVEQLPVDRESEKTA